MTALKYSLSKVIVAATVTVLARLSKIKVTSAPRLIPSVANAAFPEMDPLRTSASMN